MRGGSFGRRGEDRSAAVRRGFQPTWGGAEEGEGRLARLGRRVSIRRWRAYSTNGKVRDVSRTSAGGGRAARNEQRSTRSPGAGGEQAPAASDGNLTRASCGVDAHTSSRGGLAPGLRSFLAQPTRGGTWRGGRAALRMPRTAPPHVGWRGPRREERAAQPPKPGSRRGTVACGIRRERHPGFVRRWCAHEQPCQVGSGASLVPRSADVGRDAQPTWGEAEEARAGWRGRVPRAPIRRDAAQAACGTTASASSFEAATVAPTSVASAVTSGASQSAYIAGGTISGIRS
ncbi:hypothetical protein SAMN04489834_1855 [Microterricola viridarii]|uniref:Uncharacterized protein n=1 Tax=Microterricola viridarii TaxID=412690 RepID=A0A1H1TV68_9MICO|nr:hypothetical protein SAMN04489834_1855 [Microterricola viridarii]